MSQSQNKDDKKEKKCYVLAHKVHFLAGYLWLDIQKYFSDHDFYRVLKRSSENISEEIPQL